MAFGVPVAGGRPAYTQVSHPEILRSGYDQRLEIEDYRITVLFQGFDGSRVPDSYDYNELPWELALMQNVPVEIPVDGNPVSPTGDRDKGRSPR